MKRIEALESKISTLQDQLDISAKYVDNAVSLSLLTSDERGEPPLIRKAMILKSQLKLSSATDTWQSFTEIHVRKNNNF